MATRETRSRLQIRFDALQRLIMWHCFSGITPHYLVTEYPKSGGSWLAQMLAAYFELPFPRNRRPPLFTWQSYVLHGHHLHTRRFKNVFCIFRDGRDALTSAYYHMLFHNDRNPHWAVERTRRELPLGDYDDVKANMPAFIEYMFTKQARGMFHFNWSEFVVSWLGKNTKVITYEDLLRDTPDTLFGAIERVTQTEPDMDRLREIARQFSFENVTKRKPGEEDRTSFLRKGIAGDWKNKFTKKACEVFDRYAGEALIRAGYEKDHSWVDAAEA